MYRVHLQAFEGPLDLLLFFIRRDELDIYDIPIASIADEFLEYVRLMEQVDLDGVGDFIYMAALLISIKARMLLPSPEVDEEGEPIDPRRELVERLLEYVRYKEAGGMLEAAAAERANRFTRGDASRVAGGDAPDEVIVDGSVFSLVAALRRVLTQAEPTEEPVHAVRRFDYSVEGQQDFVLAQLAAQPRIPFVALVRERPKAFVIATFLAVLELARQGRLWVLVDDDTDDFAIETAREANATADSAASDTDTDTDA